MPTTRAGRSVPFQKLTEIADAPATTCWFVTMSPFGSYTKPEPCALDWTAEPVPPLVARISTTAFDARSYTSAMERLPDATGCDPSTVTCLTTVVVPSSTKGERRRAETGSQDESRHDCGDGEQ